MKSLNQKSRGVEMEPRGRGFVQHGKTPMLGAGWSRRPSGDSHFPGKFRVLGGWCERQRKRERKEGWKEGRQRKETEAAAMERPPVCQLS